MPGINIFNGIPASEYLISQIMDGIHGTSMFQIVR